MFTSLHLYEMFISIYMKCLLLSIYAKCLFLSICTKCLFLSIYTKCLFLSRAFYEFTVQAQEGLDIQRIGTATIYVTVEDSNDHAPQFVGAPFTFTIEENVPPGEIIGRVNASDDDAGSNERVSVNI